MLTHHVGGQLVARQIFHVFVVCVDDLCEFAAAHRLLEHPHVDRGVEAVVLGGVGAHDLGDGRAPADTEEEKYPAVSDKMNREIKQCRHDDPYCSISVD